MTKVEDIWICSECGQEHGKHDMYFDGICGECYERVLTEDEKVQLEKFIALKRLELKQDIKNINGSFCNIDFLNCDELSILLSVSYGISDGYNRDVIIGEIELERDTFELSYEIYHERIIQDFGEKEVITKI